jgi:hypothetical protein
VQPQHGGLAHGDVQIACALLHLGGEQFVDEDRSHAVPVRKSLLLFLEALLLL